MFTARAFRRLSPSLVRASQCGSSSRWFHVATARSNGVEASSSKSIFDEEESPWEQVFKDIGDGHPTTQSLLASTSTRENRNWHKQKMTTRELQAFDTMFNTIYSAVEDPSSIQVNRTLSPSAGVGRNISSSLDDFNYRIMSRRPVKWTSEADQELDRKKEDMELCDTDSQLLEWAVREVFAESQRYEEAARNSSSPDESPVYLQSPTYPHLIAELMRRFRDKYLDPYLSLAIFDYARNLSIASYVFGCTTPAYNELIETRWRCFHDLRGVCDALEEMRVNGVGMDTRTRGLAEAVRTEVSRRNIWEEETSIGSREVLIMLRRMERLTAGSGSNQDQTRRKKWTKDSEVWRSEGLQNDSEDGWEFGRWDDSQQSPQPI